MKNKKILLGTILSRPYFPKKPLRDIVDIFGVNKIFVFKIENEETNFLLTYNVDKEDLGDKLDKIKEKYKNTICLHRRIKNNVFYTINSLNKLEENENIDLSGISNSIALLDKRTDKLSIMKVFLKKVINLQEEIKYERN